MQSDDERMTHIFGLYLFPGVYEFYFISDEKRFICDHYAKKKHENDEEMNCIEITQPEKKENLIKIYIKDQVKETFILGSWDKYANKHKMLRYDQKVKFFQEKEREFIGLEELKNKNYDQVEAFQYFIFKRDFNSFHGSHYDWWAFPITAKSSYGYKYAIDPVEAELLKKDEVYMKQYLYGVKFLAFAWGWDILNADYIAKPFKDQCWSDWPIRLYKAAMSLDILRKCETRNDFDEKIFIYLKSLKKYAKILIKKYGKFD
jgi:hypothetical protein